MQSVKTEENGPSIERTPEKERARVIISRKQEVRIASDTRSAKRSENDATAATNSKI